MKKIFYFSIVFFLLLLSLNEFAQWISHLFVSPFISYILCCFLYFLCMLPVLFSSSAQRNVWLVCGDVMSICERKRRVFSTYIFHLTLPHNIPGAANIHSNMRKYTQWIYFRIHKRSSHISTYSQYVYHYEHFLLLSICMVVGAWLLLYIRLWKCTFLSWKCREKCCMFSFFSFFICFRGDVCWYLFNGDIYWAKLTYATYKCTIEMVT